MTPAGRRDVPALVFVSRVLSDVQLTKVPYVWPKIVQLISFALILPPPAHRNVGLTASHRENSPLTETTTAAFSV